MSDDPAARPPGPETKPDELPPFWRFLGLSAVEVRPGHGTVKVTVEPQHLRTLGFLHGGVLATLCDSSLGLAAWSAAPAGLSPVTIQLSVNFIRAVPLGATVLATADMQHVGRHTAVGRAEVHTEDGTLVGTASATFLYVAHDENGPRPTGRPDFHEGK